jgi:EmrB/QacA subfamily drug resistance transporter
MAENTSGGINKKGTLMIAAIAAFVGSYMMSAVTVALPTIGKELAAEAVMLSWVANAVAMAQAMVLIPAGRFADIYGRKKVFLAGMFLFAASNLACVYVNSVVELIVYRVIQGMGAGILIVAVVAILTSTFPASERGKALGINVGATYAGLSAGPFIGGVMTQHFGWRSIFILSGLLSALVIIIAFRYMKGEWADAKGEKFDFAGTGIFIVSLVLVIYGFSALLTVPGIIIFLLGAAGVAAFVWRESRIPSPIFDVTRFRKNSVFIFSNLATLISYCAAFAINFLLSLYLQYIKGMPPQTVGLVIVVQPVVMTCIAPISGRLSDKFDPRKVASLGMAFLFTAMLLYTFVGEGTSIGYIIGVLVVSGFGYGLFSSPNSNAIMGSVDKRLVGVASGALGTMRTFGMTLSMGIVMIIFSIFIGDAQITPEYYPAFLTSFKTMFIVSSALSFLGVFSQLAGLKRVKGNEKGGA